MCKLKLYLSSSSSCHVAGTDIPDHSLATSTFRSSPLAGLQDYIPYSHIAAVCTFEVVILLLLGQMWESITYDLVTASPAVSCMSGSSNLDSFRDGRQVAVWLVLCGVLLPGHVQYSLQYSCVIAV